LLNHPFKITGIVAHGKGARFFIPLRAGQDIVGADNRVSMFFVRSKGDTEATRAEILKLNPQNRIRSMSEYVTLMSSSNLPEMKPFIRTMVGLGIVVSFLVVLMNMHTMVMERTREIGILKETNPSLPILLTPGWVLGSIGLALLGAGLGATVPAVRASSFDPVEALS